MTPKAAVLKGGSRVPAVVFCMLGLVPLAIGLFLAADRAVVVLRWPEAPAVVTESRIETKGSQHAARIRVRFEAEDGPVEVEPAHGHQSADYATVAEALERLPAGAETFVRYDPDDPRRARLEPAFDLATFGSSLLLLAASAVLLGVGALAFRSVRLAREAASARSPEEKAHAQRRDVWGVGLFVLAIGAFMAIGGAALLPSAIEERSWPVAAARVDRGDVYTRSVSRTGKHAGSVTYHVARLFLAYEHEGRSLLAPLDVGQFQDRKKTEALLASIAKGAQREIRVNPRRPQRIRAMSSWPLALPIVLIAVGGLVTWVAVFVIRRYALAA
jgi:hypothetical protein